MAKRSAADAGKCRWISEREAFRLFATHAGKTQSARHIKPLHWYIACRLVLEGGFAPEDITPRPPFRVERKKIKSKGTQNILHYDPEAAGGGEQVILGGLKTKNVDVVVAKNAIGPVLAISCKGVTKAFRNLTNRMEETIGECTNLHITYPAMVIGYFVIMRANRTIEDAAEAPDLGEDDTPAEVTDDAPDDVRSSEAMAANDIAITEDGIVVEGISRFHTALCEMTARRGIRDEISRYEAMAISLVEPTSDIAGQVFSAFPLITSAVHASNFFATLYQRYEERFVYGAPLLAERTERLEWSRHSPALRLDGYDQPQLDYVPRLASD